MDKITDKRMEKYFKLTRKALDKIKVKKPRNVDLKKVAELFLDTAQRYYEDAEYFKKNGDFVTAFAAINYAHGWLDAGKRLGIFSY